jgi:predicted nuclease of predicted toxin-antitoxin system
MWQPFPGGPSGAPALGETETVSRGQIRRGGEDIVAKLLIDECLHTSLLKLAHEAGHTTDHVNYLGLGSSKDWDLMKLILDRDYTFVTNNRTDFLALYGRTQLHAGLVIIVPNVMPSFQRELRPSATTIANRPQREMRRKSPRPNTEKQNEDSLTNKYDRPQGPLLPEVRLPSIAAICSNSHSGWRSDLGGSNQRTETIAISAREAAGRKYAMEIAMR